MLFALLVQQAHQMGGVLHSPTTPSLRGSSWSTLVLTTTSLDSCFKFSFNFRNVFCNFTSLFEIFKEKNLFYHVLAFNVNA